MQRLSGYSLLEMLITLVVASLLLKVALPSYTSQMLKVARTDAKAGLLEVAGWQERYYTRYLQYSVFPNPWNPAPETQISSAKGHYLITVSACEGGEIVYCFVARAEPVGKQLKDVCGTFFLDSSGRKTVSNQNAENCW